MFFNEFGLFIAISWYASKKYHKSKMQLAATFQNFKKNKLNFFSGLGTPLLIMAALGIPAEFRHIKMYSHNNSNLSLAPVFSDEQVVDHNYKRYSFTTGALYDERAPISVLLEKLVTDGGRYTKYHPNVMLALFASH